MAINPSNIYFNEGDYKKKEKRQGQRVQKITSKQLENHQFYQGDIGSVRTSKLLIQKLSEEEDKWDQLIVTAGVFPDWENPRQEDGVDKVISPFSLYLPKKTLKNE